jgi:hypothetical protein
MRDDFVYSNQTLIDVIQGFNETERQEGRCMRSESLNTKESLIKQFKMPMFLVLGAASKQEKIDKIVQMTATNMAEGFDKNKAVSLYKIL